MNFSKHVISTLKNFATINPGIHLKPGNVILTRSADGATYAEAMLAPEETIPFDVAIYDLNGFLNILSLSGDDADVTVPGKILVKGKRSKIHWDVAEEDQVVSPKNQINFPEPVLQFDLAADEFNQLMKISRGLGGNTIAISNKDDKVVIYAYNKDVDTKLERPLSTFEAADYAGKEDFNFIINLGNMKMVNSAYAVKIWAKGNRFATRWEGETVNYVIAVEDGSSHTFG